MTLRRARPNVSHRLGTLRMAEVVEHPSEGIWVYYRLGRLRDGSRGAFISVALDR